MKKQILFIFLIWVPYLYAQPITNVRSEIKDAFTDYRDGKTYKTVKIGNQIWMAENLNYDIGNESYCYRNDSTNCNKFGRLYTWEAAKRSVPPGWHLPTKNEFEQFLSYLGGAERTAYQKLIEDGASNVLFGGWRIYNGGYDYLGSYAFFWSSTEFLTDYAWDLNVGSDNQEARLVTNNRTYAFSVRCVKDSAIANLENEVRDSLTDLRDGKTYKTVRIGKQVWMAENLNYDAGDGSYCYNDSSTNCSKYGRLYSWETAKKAVPPGWHLPSKSEFERLLSYLEDDSRTTYQQLVEGGGSSLNVLFGGWRNYNGFGYLGSSALLWSSTETENNGAWHLYVIRRYRSARLSTDFGHKASAFSVRCVKD